MNENQSKTEVRYIGGNCPSCGTRKEWGLCPNKKCSIWTFGDNLNDYDDFFIKAKEHYSKTNIVIEGKRHHHGSVKKSWCPTCKQTFRFGNEPTTCGNCDQKLKWKPTKE
jgi:NAD-dependent SIR2 family protein deacetylase